MRHSRTQSLMNYGLPAVAILVMAGCGGAPEIPTYTPRFSYTPKGTGGGSASIALLRAVASAPAAPVMPGAYVMPRQAGGGVQQKFLAALTTATEQSLSSRGFKIAGPYGSIDDMTFPQKKQVELAMKIIVAVEVKPPRPNVNMSAWSGVSVEVKGNCELAGYVALEAWEPLSAQKVWSKRVEMPAATEDCSGGGQNQENGMAKLYDNAFQQTMAKADDYFAPEEIELIRKQSQELREKKVY